MIVCLFLNEFHKRDIDVFSISSFESSYIFLILNSFFLKIDGHKN